jgi:hypothetical protein
MEMSSAEGRPIGACSVFPSSGNDFRLIPPFSWARLLARFLI